MKRIAIILLLLVSAAAAQNSRYDNIALGVNSEGDTVPISNGVVTVLSCTPNSSSCGTTASLCSSITDAVCGLSNSVATDIAGNYHFYALPGRYKVTVTATGFAGNVITDAVLAPSTIDLIKVPGGWNFTGGLTTTTITLPLGNAVQSIASGSALALGTTLIASNACATTVTAVATNVATTDVVTWSFNADPNGVTGYGAGATGSLSVWAFPTSNNVNFRVCNLTAGSITPGAISINWKVTR